MAKPFSSPLDPRAGKPQPFWVDVGQEEPSKEITHLPPLETKVPEAAYRFAADLDKRKQEEEEFLLRNRQQREAAKKELLAADPQKKILQQKADELLQKELNWEMQRSWQKAHFSDRCLGCGAVLQDEDPLVEGFTPSEVMPRAQSQPLRKHLLMEKKNAKRSPWLVVAEEMFAKQDDRRQRVKEARRQLQESGAQIPPELAPAESDDEEPFRSLRDLEMEMAVDTRVAVCLRCHTLRNAQEHRLAGDLNFQTSEQVRKKLTSTFGHQRFLAVVIVDVADFEGSFIDDLEQIIGGNRVILVGNKFDVLPGRVNEERVRVWIKSRAEQLRLQNIRRTLVLSAFTGHGMRSLAAAIEELRDDDDVVLIGATNVGKSTLLNGLVPRLFPGATTHATTSGIPGTTLRFLTFPFKGPSSEFVGRKKAEEERVAADAQQLQRNPYHKLGDPSVAKLKPGPADKPEKGPSQTPRVPKLIDTPGLIQYSHIDHILDPPELNLVQIKRRIRPEIIRFVAGKTLFLGGLARIDYIKGPPLYWTVFLSRKLKIHLSSIEKADELYQRQLGQLLTPPLPSYSNRLQSFPPLVAQDAILTPSDIYDQKSWQKAFADVAIAGLGWVSFTGGVKDQSIKARVRIHTPEGIGIFVRPPLMPFEAGPLTRKEGKGTRKHGKVPPEQALMHPLSRPRTVGSA